MKEKYYVAYGSNMCIDDMAYRCPDAKLIGTSTLLDYRLEFRGNPNNAYLTIAPAEGFHVPVVIWKVSQKDLKNLDYYEGYPSLYYKQDLILPVKCFGTGEIESLEVFVYVMHPEIGFGLPESFYLKTCWEAYDEFHFNKQLLMEAYNYSLKRMTGK